MRSVAPVAEFLRQSLDLVELPKDGIAAVGATGTFRGTLRAQDLALDFDPTVPDWLPAREAFGLGAYTVLTEMGAIGLVIPVARPQWSRAEIAPRVPVLRAPPGARDQQHQNRTEDSSSHFS